MLCLELEALARSGMLSIVVTHGVYLVDSGLGRTCVCVLESLLSLPCYHVMAVSECL